MLDPKKEAIIAATTIGNSATFHPFAERVKAGNFASEVLSHESWLLPSSGANKSLTERIEELNRNSPFLNQVARAWEANPNVLDRLKNQLNADPQLMNRFKASLASDARDGISNDTSRNFSTYLRNPTSQTLNTLYPAPTRAPAASTPERAPARAAASTPEPRRQEPSAPRTTTPRTEAPAAAASSPQPASGAESSAPAAAATPAGQLSVAGTQIMANVLLGQMSTIFGEEFASDEASLRSRLQTDTDLQQRLTNAINGDPALLAQLNATGENSGGGFNKMFEDFSEQNETVQAGIRDRLRPYYRDILNDPTKIGNTQFRNEMTAAATNGGMQAMFGEIGNFFKEMFSGNSQIGSFFSSIGNIFSDLMAGMKGGNLMAMFGGPGNEGGSLLDRLSTGLSQARQHGAFVNAFSPNGEFGRFNLVSVDAETGRPNLPEIRMVQPDGTMARVNADGTPYQQPQQPAPVRMAQGGPNNGSLDANAPGNGPSGPPAELLG